MIEVVSGVKDNSVENKSKLDIAPVNKTYMLPINGDVKVNAYTKDVFEERTSQVFKVIWEILSKSFGPYGAPTVISQYPYYHVTKDGFTILKNINLDTSTNFVDKVIAGMMMDICGRLNNTVGDGTTTAVIATNSIYEEYRFRKDELIGELVLPRTIIHTFEWLRDQIIDEMNSEIVSIQSDDPAVLYNNIYKIAYISSNGDREISNMIANMYKELGSPKITPMLAKDGITSTNIVEGYQLEVKLTDRLYVNSDEEKAIHKNLDVIVFDHKVTVDTYTYILKPLTDQVRSRGRHLLCIAPSYDSVALDGKIGAELNNEYSKMKDVTLILAVAFTSSNLSKLMMNDFAMLLNTRVITMSMERDIIEMLSTTKQHLLTIFNLDSRHIEGIAIAQIAEKKPNDQWMLELIMDDGRGCPVELNPYGDLVEGYINVGFTDEAACGMENSIFKGFHYDEKRYNDHKSDAEYNLKKAVQTYSKLGTFNLEITNAQKRLNALKMKMGEIMVGGTSEMSQRLLKDSVDDTVKACASAYEYGVIKGCNVSLLRAVERMLSRNDLTDLQIWGLKIIKYAFRRVYKTILSNAFDNKVYRIPFNADGTVTTQTIEAFCHGCEYIQSMDAIELGSFNYAIYRTYKENYDCFRNTDLESQMRATPESGYTVPIHDLIINYSVTANKVYDLEGLCFSDNIINSSQTDTEVLKATTDLISLLISGNQLVINAHRE